jgi:peptidoglycan/xylan/chitin deacetylase (PgdA/CDA1 family)
VHATFFLIGKNAEQHPEVVKRIAAEGHVIGHHTFHHSDPGKVSAAELIDEIDRTDDLLSEIVGKRSSLFRPPWGKVTARKLFRLWRRGQRVVLWSADPKDCDCEGSDKVRDWFRRHPVTAGDIVLMHDDHPYAADVLPDVIRSARARGLRFGTPVDGARA